MKAESALRCTSSCVAHPAGNATAYYNEFIYGCAEATNACDGQNMDALFPRSQISTDSQWIYVGILAGIFVAFRVVSCLLLHLKATRQAY